MARRRKKKDGLGDIVPGLIFIVVAIVLFGDTPVFNALMPIFLLLLFLGGVVFFIKLFIKGLDSSNTSLNTYNYSKSPSHKYEVKDSGSPEADLYPIWRDSQNEIRQAKIPETWSPELLKQLEWKRFEEVVAEYFRLRGYKAKTTKLGKDGGVDVIVYGKESGDPVSVVQCKAWNSYRVKLKEVRELLGAVHAHNVQQGIFLTTSTFTDDAIEFGKQNNLVLIDGMTFLKEINNLNPDTQKKLLAFAVQGEYWRPSCPKCGLKMVERPNRRDHSKFWGCPSYPRCWGKLTMRAID